MIEQNSTSGLSSTLLTKEEGIPSKQPNLLRGIERRLRYIPFIQNLTIRATIGFFLLVGSCILAATLLQKKVSEIGIVISIVSWATAIFFTEKYIHKYPQRYYTYTIAAHFKAACVMAFFLLALSILVGSIRASFDVVWTGYFLFVFFDGLVSVFRRSAPPPEPFSLTVPFSVKAETLDPLTDINTSGLLDQLPPDLDEALVEFIKENLPRRRGRGSRVLAYRDIPSIEDRELPAGLVIGRMRINDVRRLNRFFKYCVERMKMGGYFVLTYTPIENAQKKIKRRYKGIFYWPAAFFNFFWYRALPKTPLLDKFYFLPKISWLDNLHLSITKRRNRLLSKAEVWGRLAYWGIDVIAESKGDEDIHLIARRVTSPVQNKRPSYYPVVALEKIALDGKPIRAHKVRTMFPFSEFIQKRIFEDNGLATTGKFANDFRLTSLGKFLRKYWLDELPQLFDWLRGDVKLVGIRATSRHFLNLYPKSFLDLYVQIKPGLIPPLFSESTNGFDDIVAVELKYLKSYWDRPFSTDVRYFTQTFVDIFFRGIRSK